MRLTLRSPAVANAAAVCLLGMLVAAPARPATPVTAVAAAERGHDPVVEVNVTVDGDTYRVRGEFRVDAPTPVAWEVLTDYANIPRFVSSMRSSIVERTDDGLRVRQEAAASLFPFRRHLRLVLDVTERSLRDIAFRDVLERDFVSYAGSWELFPDSAGTMVRYSLRADPRASMPKMLGRALMNRSARGLLEQVRAEMARRATASAAPAHGGRTHAPASNGEPAPTAPLTAAASGPAPRAAPE